MREGEAGDGAEPGWRMVVTLAAVDKGISAITVAAEEHKPRQVSPRIPFSVSSGSGMPRGMEFWW